MLFIILGPIATIKKGRELLGKTYYSKARKLWAFAKYETPYLMISPKRKIVRVSRLSSTDILKDILNFESNLGEFESNADAVKNATEMNLRINTWKSHNSQRNKSSRQLNNRFTWNQPTQNLNIRICSDCKRPVPGHVMRECRTRNFNNKRNSK